MHQPLYFMAFMAFIAGAGAAAAFLAFFIAFMAFMAFGMVKTERVKRLAKRLISQAAKRKNDCQTPISQMLEFIWNDLSKYDCPYGKLFMPPNHACLQQMRIHFFDRHLGKDLS